MDFMVGISSPAEAKLSVGVVLEDHHAVCGGDSVKSLALFKGGGYSRGILEGGNEVNELDVRGFAKELFKRVRIGTVAFEGKTDGVRAAGAESVQTADKGGVLADDVVAFVAERLAGKLDPLLTAGDYHGVVHLGVDAELFFNRATTSSRSGIYPSVMLYWRAVVDSFSKMSGGDFRKLLHREGEGRGVSGGKADNGGIGEAFENLADRGGLESFKLI